MNGPKIIQYVEPGDILPSNLNIQCVGNLRRKQEYHTDRLLSFCDFGTRYNHLLPYIGPVLSITKYDHIIVSLYGHPRSGYGLCKSESWDVEELIMEAFELGLDRGTDTASILPTLFPTAVPMRLDSDIFSQQNESPVFN